MKLYFMMCSGFRIFILVFIYPVFLCFPQSVLSSNDAIGICRDYISPVTDNSKNPQSGAIPFGTGLLWKIESPDSSVSHIFGTMHSQDRLITSLHPVVRLTLAKSRSLVMEIIPDQQANEDFNNAIYFTDGTELKNILDEDIFNQFSRIAPDYGIPAGDVVRVKPWAAFSIIGRPKPVRAMTQEMVLMQIAEDTNKPVNSLETMGELVATLDSISMQDQIEILNDTVCNHSEIIRDTRELVELYIAGDLAGIVRFNNQPHHDEAVHGRFMQTMLYERNIKIIERIENYLKEGNNFIAIGAMHLPDKTGLLNLLQERGYVITSVF